jgi:methylenetetrahydrofolate reductase (NADPH)
MSADQPIEELMNTNDSVTDLKRRLVEFARGASTEISTMDEELLTTLATEIPAGISMFIAHTPKASLDDVVRVALKVQALGFRASPHIVARRIGSENALRAGLRELVDGGVEQGLLVAGDLEKPLGKFTSTLEIIDSGAIVDAGLKRVAVAGHPEGHKAVDPATLWSALKHKQPHRHQGADQYSVRLQSALDR